MSNDLVPRVVPRGDRRPAILDAMIAAFAVTPRLALTFAQARRLWDLDPTTCQHLLEYLVEEGVLRRRADGRYEVDHAARTMPA